LIGHSDLRPGTVLIALATEHAAREGVRTIDMLRGDEGYKKFWHMERTDPWIRAIPGTCAGGSQAGQRTSRLNIRFHSNAPRQWF